MNFEHLKDTVKDLKKSEQRGSPDKKLKINSIFRNAFDWRSGIEYQKFLRLVFGFQNLLSLL
jgi:hypothetical protein